MAATNVAALLAWVRESAPQHDLIDLTAEAPPFTPTGPVVARRVRARSAAQLTQWAGGFSVVATDELIFTNT